MPEADTERQILWMETLSLSNARARRPLLHHVISWGAEEPPGPGAVREAVEILERHLGLEGCPALWAAHRDTRSFHVHVVTCAVDPATLAMRRIGLDRLRAQEAAAEIEAAMRHGRPAGTDRVRRSREEPPLSSGAREFERRTGLPSAERTARERAWPAIDAARSWEELAAGLAEEGCRLLFRKGGLVLRVGNVHVKASRIHRRCRRGLLVARLGPCPSLDELEAPCILPAQGGREAPGPVPDGWLEDLREEYLGDMAEWRERRRRWAEGRKAERRALSERARAELEQTAAGVRELRKAGWRLWRGAASDCRLRIAERWRFRRLELSRRQQEDLGERFSAGFAIWLADRGHAGLPAPPGSMAQAAEKAVRHAGPASAPPRQEAAPFAAEQAAPCGPSPAASRPRPGQGVVRQARKKITPPARERRFRMIAHGPAGSHGTFSASLESGIGVPCAASCRAGTRTIRIAAASLRPGPGRRLPAAAGARLGTASPGLPGIPACAWPAERSMQFFRAFAGWTADPGSAEAAQPAREAPGPLRRDFRQAGAQADAPRREAERRDGSPAAGCGEQAEGGTSRRKPAQKRTDGPARIPRRLPAPPEREAGLEEPGRQEMEEEEDRGPSPI